MAGKLDFDPGQAAMGHQLTISEILAEYLMERGRLAPKTHARYTEVIVLFTQSLNGYAANSLSQFDRARLSSSTPRESSIASSAICSAPSIFSRMSVSF
jgi:hypothetical protein